jgi:hypothetical protein
MQEKTKISSHVISAINEVVKDFFIVMFILVVPLFIWLYVGIHIQNLHFRHYFVDGLYIKLDKKLILKANKVVIPKNKSKPSFSKVEKTFNNIKNILDYFEYIELNNIEFENNKLTVLYSDDVFFLSTKEYSLSSIVKKHHNTIEANITSLYINKANVELRGVLKYHLKTDILHTHGKFAFSDSNGTFEFSKNKDDIAINISSGTFSDIQHIIAPWKIPANIHKWLAHKLKAKHYKLDHFFINGKLDSEANLVLDFKNIDAKVVLQDVDIYFDKNLPSVKTKQLDIIYSNNRLYFNAKSPKYQNRDLNGSYVIIQPIISNSQPVAYLHLHVKSQLDNIVSKVLTANKVYLPIQFNKKQVCDISIDIPFDSNKRSKTVVDCNLTKGRFYVSTIPLDIQKGRVRYKNQNIKLQNIWLKNRNYNLIVNGNINTKAKQISLKSKVKQIKYTNKDKQTVFLLKNKNIPISINYAKNIIVNLSTLKTKLVVSKNKVDITISKLSKVLPYIKNLPIELYDGVLHIASKDFIKYAFDGIIKWKECFLFQQKNSCMSSLKIKGYYKNNNIKLYAVGKKLYIDTKRKTIKLNKLNIDLEQFLKAKIKQSSKSNKKLYIAGKKSTIRYKTSHLLTDSYDIVVYPNGNVKAMGSLDNDIVKFEKVAKNISIKAYRVKDKMLHPLINFDGLKRGRYTLKVSGNPDKKLKGEILIEGGVIKDFKAYNNTLAFINSIPALATFSKPGFSTKGYEIKEGMILYHKIKDKIYLDSIYIKGKSGNVAGKGVIDLKHETLDVSLAVQVAKDFGKIISKIPLIGYIIMGDDNSLTLGLNIKGSFKKPVVTNTVAKDIISLPFEMLKRTFGGR